jgi:membrane protein DedA with SNARE-associated domain
MQMSLWRFVAIDTLASLIFVPALCGVGYLFADQIDVIARWFQRVERTIGTLVGLALLVWLWRRHWGKRKSSAPVTPP